MFYRLVHVGRRCLKFLTSSLALRRIRHHRRLLLLEPLAARQVLASYAAAGDSATLTLGTTGENLSITADASDYVVTTSSGSGWSGPVATGVTVSGATMRLSKGTFTGTITIADQSGISGGRVTFTPNANATYGANFTVSLDDSPGAVTFANNANPNFGAKNLSITTTGGSGNIVFNAGATVTATAGNISLNSGGAITLASSASIASNSGDLSLTAGTSVSATVDTTADVAGTDVTITAGSGISLNTAVTSATLAVSSAGAINVSDTAGGLIVTSATTANGAINLSATGGNLTVSSATAGGTSTSMTLSTMTSGNITLTSVTNTGDRVTVNSAGAIVDSADSTTDITAADVVLIATTGIGVAGSATDTELEIEATNLDVRNATSGGVKVNRTGGSLTVTDVDGSGGAHRLNGGGYLVAANALTLSMSLTTDENFTFTASNSPTADDDLTINANAVMRLTNPAARTLTFQAGDDLILGTGTGGSILADGGGLHTVVLDVDREGATVADSDRGSVTQDSGATTRVTAATLTVTAPDGVGSASQSVNVAAGVLTVNSSGNNGSQFLVEADGLTGVNLDAASGAILLNAVSGSLIDTDGAVDVTAAAFGFSSGAGSLGNAANPINASVARLEVNAAGAVYFSNASDLEIGGVMTTLSGIDATGEVDIRAIGEIIVNENVTTTSGAVSLQARESATNDTGDNLVISDSVTIATGAGAITLNGGDGMFAAANTLFVATTTLTINVDNAAGALGADNDTSDGGFVDFDTASPDPAITAPGGLIVSGGANVDTFELKPFASGAITVNGGAPTSPARSDKLTLDLSNVAVGKATLLLGSSPASGVMTFGVGETEKTVTFNSVEEVSADPASNPYHLVLDMAYSGFTNSEADTIAIRRTDGPYSSSNLLEIEINGTGVPFFSGAQSGILSLTVIGSTDDDLLRITETAFGLPQLATSSAAIGAVPVNNSGLTPPGGTSDGSRLVSSSRAYLAGVTNTQVADWDRSDVAIHFDGGSSLDVDKIQVVMARPHTVSAVGTAAQGNLVATIFPAELGGEGAGGLDLLVSYANLSATAPVEWIGAGGGVLADGSATSATTEIVVSDFNVNADNGVNIVQGNNGFIEQTFSGFNWLYVLGGDGAETIRLESLDTTDPDELGDALPIYFVTLDGDNFPTIQTLLTATALQTATGRLGTDTSDDTLVVEALPGGVDVYLLGGAGNDIFRVYNDFDTTSMDDDSVAGFAGSVFVSPASMVFTGAVLDSIGPDESGGSDSLIVRDFADGIAPLDSGDFVLIASGLDEGSIYIDGALASAYTVTTNIEGLFDDKEFNTSDIRYSQIESLTVELGAGDDEVILGFNGVSGELRTVMISGNDGNDQFRFISDTPYGAELETPQSDADIPVLTILGERGNDSFILYAELFGVGTCVDGGEGQDKLDFSNFGAGLEVYLVTIGAIDGYQGYEGDWGIARGDGESGGGDVVATREQGDYPCFTNIDVLAGSQFPYDVLYGADRTSYWNLAGYEDDTRDAGIVMDGLPLSIDSDCQCGGYVGQDLAFTDMENLYGGGQRDWFDVGPNFRLTGAIGGGEHGPVGDTLDMRDRTDNVAVDLTELTASFAGGIDVVPDISPTSRGSGKLRPRLGDGPDVGASIENLLGGSGNDTLIGDADVNLIAGHDGDDTLNGKAGVDSVDGGLGNDVLQVADTEAVNDVSIGGTGEPLDPLDADLMVNVGSGAVTLGSFNTGSTDFSNSIDEYDGNGAGLILVASGGRMHLGSTLLINTPTVSGGAGNDAVTVSYENAVATAYSGGAGTADSLTLTLEATDIQSMLANMTLDDIVTIQAFINAPAAGPLQLTGDATKGNYTVANDFESVRIAVYDSGQIVDITSCFRQIVVKEQIQFGTEADNSMNGTLASDLIFGMGGNDIITRGTLAGSDGVDCMFGGAGNDTVTGGENTDTIAGGLGDDSLDGEGAADLVLGGLGNDIVSGNFGDDVLFGNAGQDTVLGGGDSDMMYGGAGDDSLDGQAGNDSIWGQAGDDKLIGSEGDDVLNGGTDSRTSLAHDTVDGGVGNDNIQTQGCESEYDSIQGGPGSNSITNIDTDGDPSDLVFDEFLGQSNNIRDIYGNGARITGNNDANYLDFRITATAGEFVRLSAVSAIDGCAGDDTIHGTLGADTIFGSSDNDTIYGYNLGDRLDGGSGSDKIYGGPDSDTIFGGSENDSLYGETGNDSIYGGSGSDRLFGQEGNDILDGQQDADTLEGGVGNDVFPTRADEAEFDSLNGGVGSDRLINTGMSNLVLDGFDGPGNGLEEVVVNYYAILGNRNANTFDFRYGTTTSFVQIFTMSFLSGEGGDDIVRGSDIAETLLGGDGNDIIFGNGGADSIDGGGGNDVLSGGADGDMLFGNAGDDRLDGGNGNDTMTGGVGNDSLEGGEGNDVLNGGTGTDAISGSGGEDEIRTQASESYDDTISGGTGKDRIVNLSLGVPLVFKSFDGPTRGIETIFGGNAPFSGDGTANIFDFRLSTTTTTAMSFVSLINVLYIELGNGADILNATNASDTIYGRGGDDVIHGWGGNDTIEAGVGNDVVNGGADNDRILGGDGEDLLNGDGGADLILGQGNVDRLSGGNGDDTLDGGDGLNGGIGDRVDGGAGNDVLWVRGSEAEFDVILGGAGTDRIVNTSAGTDMIMNSFVALAMQVESFSANNARLLGNSNANTFDLRLNATGSLSLVAANLTGIDGLDGNDTIHGTKNADTITGGAGADLIFGYDGGDTLSGGDGDDTIDGGAGNDLLQGEAGDDVLLGGAGNDSLIGALGVDRLTGGAGNDVFRFDAAAGDSTQIDVMLDYSSSDTVRFVGYAFDTVPVTYGKLILSAPNTANAVLHLTNGGTVINATTVKRISTPGLKAKPTSTKVLFS